MHGILELSAVIRHMNDRFVARTPELEVEATGLTPEGAFANLKATVAERIAERGPYRGPAYFTRYEVEGEAPLL